MANKTILRVTLLSIFLATAVPNLGWAQGSVCSGVFLKADPIASHAEALSLAHLHNFDRLFSETGGTGNYAAYEKMLRARTEPEIVKAIEVLDKNQVEINIRAPEHVREDIASSGFKSTHETATTVGRDIDGSKGRMAVESNIFGFDLKEYKDLPAAVKTKYGSVQPKPESGLTAFTETLSAYGTDTYHLKTEKVAPRLSFTIDDSNCVIPFGQVETTKEWFDPAKGRKWYHSAIPWNRRLLMVPFLARGIQHRNLFVATSFNKAYDLRLEGPPTEIASSYIEAQIFGGVDINSVAAFEFANTPPSGKFLAELKKRNIKILDGRSQPAHEWTE